MTMIDQILGNLPIKPPIKVNTPWRKAIETLLSEHLAAHKKLGMVYCQHAIKHLVQNAWKPK